MTSYTTPIQKLARLVHSLKSRRKYLAMLIAHYDYSGQYESEAKLQDDGPVLTLGGYISSAEKWDEFEARWETALSRKHLSIMHVTDFTRTSAGWSDLERKEFLEELTTIIRETTFQGIYTSVKLKDYVEIVEKHVPMRIRKWKHGRWKKRRAPYIFVLWHCLMFIRDVFLPLGEKIAIVYEDDKRLRSTLDVATREAIQISGWNDVYELPPNFRPKGDPHALEAADILAYVGRYRHPELGSSNQPWNEYLNIDTLRTVMGGSLSRESLIVLRDTYIETYGSEEP